MSEILKRYLDLKDISTLVYSYGGWFKRYLRFLQRCLYNILTNMLIFVTYFLKSFVEVLVVHRRETLVAYHYNNIHSSTYQINQQISLIFIAFHKDILLIVEKGHYRLDKLMEWTTEEMARLWKSVHIHNNLKGDHLLPMQVF